MNLEPLLEAQGLTKVYTGVTTGLTALAQISMQLCAGELVVITGPSGSGKTTLLNVLGCLDAPSAGRLIVAGRDTSALDREQVAHLRGEYIGFVFQQSHLIRHLTALENVLLPFTLARVPSDVRRAQELLEVVGLADRMQHRPAQLSGGEQQRVAIARALVRNPRIILADEPTGNLDQKNSAEIIALLAGLVDGPDGHLVVIVTHQPESVFQQHRRLQLVDGRLNSSLTVGQPRNAVRMDSLII